MNRVMRLNIFLLVSLCFSRLFSAGEVVIDDSSIPFPAPLPPRAVMDSFFSSFPLLPPPRATIDMSMPIRGTQRKLIDFQSEASEKLCAWLDNLSRDGGALFVVNKKGSYYTLLEVKTKIMNEVWGLSFLRLKVGVTCEELYQTLRTELLTKIEGLIERRLGLVNPSDQMLATCIVVGEDGQPCDRTKGAFIAAIREALSEIVVEDDSDSEPDYFDLPFRSGDDPSRSGNDFTSLDDLDIFSGI